MLVQKSEIGHWILEIWLFHWQHHIPNQWKVILRKGLWKLAIWAKCWHIPQNRYILLMTFLHQSKLSSNLREWVLKTPKHVKSQNQSWDHILRFCTKAHSKSSLPTTATFRYVESHMLYSHLPTRIRPLFALVSATFIWFSSIMNPRCLSFHPVLGLSSISMRGKERTVDMMT